MERLTEDNVVPALEKSLGRAMLEGAIQADKALELLGCYIEKLTDGSVPLADNA